MLHRLDVTGAVSSWFSRNIVHLLTYSSLQSASPPLLVRPLPVVPQLLNLAPVSYTSGMVPLDLLTNFEDIFADIACIASVGGAIVSPSTLRVARFHS